MGVPIACPDCGVCRPDTKLRRDGGGWCAGCIAFLYASEPEECYRAAVLSQEFEDKYGQIATTRVRELLGLA